MSKPAKVSQRFNFSLREALFAMVAIAALMALGVKSYVARPFALTGFYNSLDVGPTRALIGQIGQELGITIESQGAGAGESIGGGSASREIRLTMRAPPEFHAKILNWLRGKISQMLASDGCRVVSSAGSAVPGRDNLMQFAYTYEKEGMRGHVFVHRVPTESDELGIYIMLHEFQK